MASSIPPVMQGPPMTPPNVPTLSSMPMGAAPGTDAPAAGAGVPRLFFQVNSQLELIARVLPTYAADLNEIADRLKDVAARALGGGPPLTPPPSGTEQLAAESAPRPLPGGGPF